MKLFNTLFYFISTYNIRFSGSMKTYWLQSKKFRTPIGERLQETEPTEVTESVIESVNKEDRKSVVYSPITFHDVARRSIASSPVKYSSARGKFKYKVEKETFL